MNSFRTEPLVLSGEQFMQLANSLCRPDREYMDRRDAIFAKMDGEISIKRDGMDLEVEIPDLDLSFIDEMHRNEKRVFSSTIELSGEVSYILNGINVQNVFSAIAESRLKTVSNIEFDCSNNMTRVALEKCVYNQMGVDKPMIYVKERNINKTMQPCKTEQIIYAA